MKTKESERPQRSCDKSAKQTKRDASEEYQRHIFRQKLKQVEELRWKEIESLTYEDLSTGCRDNYSSEG